MKQVSTASKIEEVIRLFKLSDFGFSDGIAFDCGINIETKTAEHTHSNGFSVDITLTRRIYAPSIMEPHLYDDNGEEYEIEALEMWDMQGDIVDSLDLTDEQILKIIL